MAERARAFDLFVLAPLGLAVLAYQLAEPAEVVPPAALVACIVGRVVQDATGFMLGKTLTAVSVALAILYVTAEVIRAGFDVTLFADFMMILAALKAFERRTPRDDGQLLVVSIFVALSAAVSSNQMGTGVLLVIYVFALMLAVMRVQIDAALWPRPSERRGGLWPLLGACVVGSTLVSVVAFVLLPRSTARFSPPGLSPMTQRVSGFNESIELGTGGLISQDPREVMRLWPLDRDGEAGDPFSLGTVVHLRGQVLTQYEAGRWMSPEPGTLGDDLELTTVRPGTPLSLHGSTDHRMIRVAQYAGASGGGTIFLPWRPIFLRFDDAVGDLTRDRRSESMLFAEPQGGTIEFVVRYGPDRAPSWQELGWTEPSRSGSEVLRSEAARILRERGIDPDGRRRPASEDRAAIGALAEWLRSSKEYTLDVQPAPPGQDPTEWFVTTAEAAGHCEYFASALALLCRDAGINSRVVTGYLAVAEGEGSEFIRVRRSDAHAWVEAEVTPGVWATFDATPAATFQRTADRVDPITRWLSSIESVWLASFISYDARSQSRLSQSLERVVDWNRLGADAATPGATGNAGRRWVPVIGGLSLAALSIGGLVVLRRKRRAQGTDLYVVRAEAARARDALEQSWSDAGTPRPPGVTLVQHARAVGHASVPEAERIERLAFAGTSG